MAFFPQLLWFLIIDDTFDYRAPQKAPESEINHQRGNEANRHQYARTQWWMSMSLSVTRGNLNNETVSIRKYHWVRGKFILGQLS